MNTPCVLPPVKTRKRRGPSKRVGMLEEKVDGLMSLLNANQGNESHPPQPSPSNGQAPQPETQTRSRIQWPPSSSLRAVTQQGSEHSTPTLPSVADGSGTDSLIPPAPPAYVEIIPGFRMTFDEADAHLDEYRSVFTAYFPFVPIPVAMSACELYDATPFLLRTILQVVAAQTLEVQRSVDRWFRQYLATHLLVEQERRLELLQAILVYVAWGDFQFYIESQATDLLQLAGTLVVDLRLDKSPDSLGVARLSFVPDAIRKVKGPRKEGHTLDDMRAMLGFSYLDSVVTTLYRRTRSFVFTPYLARCCDTLLAAQEHDTDKFLVALIYMQRLLSRVCDAMPSPDQDEDAPQAVTAPLHMMMANTRKELDKMVRDSTSDVQSNVLFWTTYNGVLMRLYEPAIHMRPTGRQASPPSPSNSARRTEALSHCLQAARDFFAAYASVPPGRLGALPLVATAYLSFAVVTASRVLLLGPDDPDWDAGLARVSFDFAAACAGLAGRFEQADRLAQAPGQRARRRFDNGVDASVLAANGAKILWIRSWYLAKVAAGAQQAGGAGTGVKQVASVAAAPAGMTGSAAAQSVGLDSSSSSSLPVELDDAFWSALLSFNEQGTNEGNLD